MSYVEMGFVFALNWLIFVTGGIVFLLLMIYLLRRATSPKAVEIEERPEPRIERGVEDDLEAIAAISAVIASLSRPTVPLRVRASLEHPTSIWKISSLMHTSRYGGMD